MMTPFEGAVRGSLEGSHGGRAHVRDDHDGATALHHYRGLNWSEPQSGWVGGHHSALIPLELPSLIRAAQSVGDRDLHLELDAFRDLWPVSLPDRHPEAVGQQSLPVRRFHEDAAMRE